MRCCSPHIGLTFYEENCMDIITTFGARGKIEPENGPQRNGFFGGLLKKRLLKFSFSKIFLIKVSHFITEHLEHI